MRRVFNSQNKRIQSTRNHLRNHVDHFNSVFFFNFLPRRPKFDEIGERFLLETKRDEINE